MVAQTQGNLVERFWTCWCQIVQVNLLTRETALLAWAQLFKKLRAEWRLEERGRTAQRVDMLLRREEEDHDLLEEVVKEWQRVQRQSTFKSAPRV